MANKRFLGKYDGKKYGWWKDGKLFVLLLVLVLLFFRFVVGFSFVSGSSMNNTLVDGQLVFYWRLGSNYDKGDILAIKTTNGEYYVKRIVATEGDTVDIHDGNLYVNDEFMGEEYAIGSTEPQNSSVRYPFTVEEDDYFVLGDNREVSLDSRTLGAIKKSQIQGRLFLVIGKGAFKFL